MKIIRENMFLVILAGITLIACAAQIVIGMSSFGAQADEGAAKRVELSEQLRNVAAAKVNEAVVAEAQRRGKEMKDIAEWADAALVKSSRGGYEVVSIDMAGKMIDVFPISLDDNIHRSLPYKMPEKYKELVGQLLQRLHATDAPTADEIKDEAARLASIPAAPTTGPVRPDVPDIRGRDGGGAPVAGDQAIKNTVWEKSRKGQVYASEQSLYAPSKSLDRFSDEDLWFAQVAAWVQRDIVEAIALTNLEQKVAVGGDESGVALSPVKRLVRVNLLGYAVGGAGEVGMGAGGMAPAAAVSGGAVSRIGYVSPAGAAGMGGGATMGVSEQKLTGRTCNKLYDVVHYEFTVVIPLQHLLTLEANLMKQNYHTILSETKVALSAKGLDSAPPVAGGGPGNDAVKPDYYYYYGTEPVVEVTITGELLMAAEWTRGHYDAKTKKWDEPSKDAKLRQYPPLMPKDVLVRLARADQTMLRDGDRERAGNFQTGPGIGGPGGGPGFGPGPGGGMRDPERGREMTR